MRLVVDTVEFATRHMPKWNPISISGYHIREAGSTAVQELAFTLANGLEYVRWCLERGLEVDDFAPRLSFFFNVHNDFFEEIAKLRAARKIWAREMKETFGAKNPRSWWMRTHAQTAGYTLTAQQPENNVIRVALQGLAAVLGGCQSLHTNSRDEAMALPSEEAVTIALRTQQVIAHESGVADTIDPLAGSYYIESMTDRIEAIAVDYIEKIDELGGMVEAIMKGFPQAEIQSNAYQWQKDVDSLERITVGVNKFQRDEEQAKGLLKVDAAVEDNQKKRLAALRLRRDNKLVEARLEKLRLAAKGQDNLMPHILASVEAYATLGEISDSLREVFGLFEEVLVI